MQRRRPGSHLRAFSFVDNCCGMPRLGMVIVSVAHISPAPEKRGGGISGGLQACVRSVPRPHRGSCFCTNGSPTALRGTQRPLRGLLGARPRPCKSRSPSGDSSLKGLSFFRRGRSCWGTERIQDSEERAEHRVWAVQTSCSRTYPIMWGNDLPGIEELASYHCCLERIQRTWGSQRSAQSLT